MADEILLIDYHSLARPIWEANSQAGDSVHVSIIARVRALASAHPRAAICVDTPPYFRKELSADYKAKRPATEAPMRYQFDLALDTLRADGFLVLGAKGFEADDIIASAVDVLGKFELVSGVEYDYLIATSDKDLSQLVCETVTIFGLSKSERYDVESIETRYGVHISQLLDYFCLCGDASDGVKGADKIGPKGAEALLKEFGSCDGIFAAFDKGATFTMTPNLRTRLQEFRARYPLVKSLIQLRTDAPCDFAAVLRPRTAGDVAEFDASADYVYQPGDAECALMPVATEANGDRVDTATGEVFDSLEDVMPNTPPAAVAAMFDERGMIDETPVVAAIPTGWRTADPCRMCAIVGCDCACPTCESAHARRDATGATPVTEALRAAAVAVNDAGRSASNARPIESGADVAKRLTDAGHRFTIGDGGKLLVSDAARLSEDDRAAIRTHRDYLLTQAKPEPTQALAIIEAVPVSGEVDYDRQLEPVNLTQAQQLSVALHKSRLFSAYGTPEGVLATVIAGRELGMPAMASLRAFHIIENKPTLSADAMRALVLKSGKAEYFRCAERTPERATFVTKRRGEPEMPLTCTMDEAKTAGVIKPGSGWVKYPADMLVARASSKLARLVYPDVVGGLYAPEESDNS